MHYQILEFCENLAEKFMLSKINSNMLAFNPNDTKFMFIFGTKRKYEEKVRRKKGNIYIMKLHIVA
jgi:hypothetical protein